MKKENHVDERGGRQKKQALSLSLSVNNSYYRGRLKETSDTLSIFNTINKW